MYQYNHLKTQGKNSFSYMYLILNHYQIVIYRSNNKTLWTTFTLMYHTGLRYLQLLQTTNKDNNKTSKDIHNTMSQIF